jgi:GTP-binding protein LepA
MPKVRMSPLWIAGLNAEQDAEWIDVERVMEEIDRDLGLDPFASIQVSAELGTGVDELLEAIVQQLPPPKGDPQAPLRALLFDAQYDAYRGAVLLVRLFDGTLRAGTRVRFMHSGAEHKVEGVGCQRLKRVPVPELSAGEVGYETGRESVTTDRDYARFEGLRWRAPL